MFFGIIFFVIGLAILLNALGILVGNFWSIFWGVVFIAIGIKMMKKRGICPMCRMGAFSQKMHGKFHEGNDCCGQCNENNCGEQCCESREHK